MQSNRAEQSRSISSGWCKTAIPFFRSKSWSTIAWCAVGPIATKRQWRQIGEKEIGESFRGVVR
jgi:hypothetical protein